LEVLYIVSVEEAAGKTAVCAGIGKYLMYEGKKVGYRQPREQEETGTGDDMSFMKQVLGLSGMDASDVMDIVIMEGMLGKTADDTMSQTAFGTSKEMKAKVIAVEAYSGKAPEYLDVYKGFGENLSGVIINKVPESQLKLTREEAAGQCDSVGIKLLGVLPENRVLFAITVGELADSVRGKILNNADKSTDLVENYMLGAMVVDSGLDYFGRKNNKAAIIRQDRPDMQLAALETETKCLVLSGSSAAPMYNVSQKAESRGIPIIATDAAAEEVIANIEAALSKNRVNEEQKLPKLVEIIKQNIDLEALI
jgi:BioD-like phosphotransacetylase family protein